MEWYVLKTRFTRREGAPVQFTKEKHSGPFDREQKARAVADKENALRRKDESYYVGTKDDIGVYGIIV